MKANTNHTTINKASRSTFALPAIASTDSMDDGLSQVVFILERVSEVEEDKEYSEVSRRCSTCDSLLFTAIKRRREEEVRR